MCEPTSLAIASLAVTALATGASVYGQIQAGKAAQDQAAYQAGVARNNEILAKRAADDARVRGELEMQQAFIKNQNLLGRQRAVLAANGVDVNTGSALQIQKDTAQLGKLERLTIRSNAEREALGFEAQGMNFNADAQLATLKGDAAAASSRTAAFSTALTGAGDVASKWYAFKKEGVFGSGGGFA